MEIGPKQLLGACVALFAGVVALNFVEQYRSNAQFKERLGTLDIGSIRGRLLREEGITNDVPEMEQPSVWPTADLTESASEDG